MTIIDSQVHAYEANTPKRPWHSVPNWPDHVTGDEMVAAMDKVGVDGAIFISAFSMYQYDASYAVEVQRAHPGRLALVKPVDPDDPAVEDIIADWKKTAGAVGIRIILTKEANRDPKRSASRPYPARGGAVRFSGQHPMLGQRGRGNDLDRSSPRYAFHHRPSRPPAATHASRSRAALGRVAKSVGAGQARERSHKGEWGVYSFPRAVSVPRHLGPVGARVRCVGHRPLLVGHGLDAGVRGGQLRAGHQTVRRHRTAQRQRARDADGGRVRQSLRLVADAGHGRLIAVLRTLEFQRQVLVRNGARGWN